jgi:hypothetical protein
MKSIVIIGCVVLYIAAGYITAWHCAKINGQYDGEMVFICVLFWPVILFSVLIWWITADLPRKIFNKFRKQ